MNNNNKIVKTAKENYIKGIEGITKKASSEIDKVLTRYYNRAFNLAVKHLEIINQIKEEHKDQRTINNCDPNYNNRKV